MLHVNVELDIDVTVTVLACHKMLFIRMLSDDVLA
jgi:hypothetical protein